MLSIIATKLMTRLTTRMVITLNVVRYEFKRIFSDRDLRLMVFVAPLIYGLLLPVVYSSGRLAKLPIGIIDHDNTHESRTVRRYLQSTEGVAIKQIYESKAEANEALLHDEIYGFMEIPKNYSASLKRGKEARLQLVANSTNFMVANTILGAGSEVVSGITKKLFQKKLMKKGLARTPSDHLSTPLVLESDISFNPALSYSLFMIPSLLFAIIQQIILVALAFTMAKEREENNLSFLNELCQGKFTSLIFGKSIPYIVINTCFILVILFGAFPLYGLALVSYQHIMWAFFFAFAFVVAITFFGMMISLFFKTSLWALICLMFYSLPVFLLSGYSWPNQGMGTIPQLVRIFFPSTFFFSEWRSLVLGNSMPEHLYMSFFILFLFTSVTLFISTYFYRRLITLRN